MDADPAPSPWSTLTLPAARRFDAWREAVARTHLPWDIPARGEARFDARLRETRLGAARLVDCACDPCDGRRGPPEIAASEGEWFGVLLVHDGLERLRQGGREASLRGGDLCVWDSRRPIAFEIGERLRKTTLLVPQALLRAAVPGIDDRVACTLSVRTGAGAVLSSHLRALGREGARLPGASVEPLLAATARMLAAALSSPIGAPSRAAPLAHPEQLARARAYIDLHLGDPELGPARVAAALGISTRQLHRVFHEGGLAVERCIREARLDRCRAEMLVDAGAPLSAIAFRCGFNDAAHFSRAFRARFGASPREFRRHAAPAAP